MDSAVIKEEAGEYTCRPMRRVKGISQRPRYLEYEPEPKQRVFTYEDYAAIPERVEVIHSFVFMMASPMVVHQMAAGSVFAQLYQQLRGHPCTPFVAPMDVELRLNAENTDDFTVVQPDVLIVCDPQKIDTSGHIKGAPDFVLEVLSPSTRENDILIKANEYAQAGVTEYWILDPDTRKLTMYVLEGGVYRKTAGIDAAGVVNLRSLNACQHWISMKGFLVKLMLFTSAASRHSPGPVS
jgi:Uma2 family endonuclease